MTRRLCAAALGLCFLASHVQAQSNPHAGSTTSGSQTARYWIVVGNDGGADAAPTPRALARRALRASNDAPAHPDRDVNPEAVAALRARGVEPVHTSRWLGAVSADLTPEQAAAVRALPAVSEVRRTAHLVEQGTESLAPYALAASPVMVAFGPSAAQLQFVKADQTINAGRTAAGVLFGILDTLFDFDHPALRPIKTSGRLVGQRDYIGGAQTDYHGLATSSIALGFQEGKLVGPAYGARVLTGTTEFAPSETHAEEDAFVAGLEWMEQQGVDVVSVSLGYSTFDPGQGDYTYADMNGNTAKVTKAADTAADLGVSVVVSAGNEGASAWRYITAPADGDNVIAVGAATSTRTRASFSSVGPTFDGRTKPDVSALGVGVYVARKDGALYEFGNGTSFSAPMVAGVAAQMLGARPSLKPLEVREALRQTASNASAPNNELGWGIIDAAAALAAATSAEPAPGDATSWTLAPSVARAGRALTITSTSAQPQTVDVVDVLGRRVASWDVPQGRSAVTVPGLPTGAYFVIVPDGPALRLTVVR